MTLFEAIEARHSVRRYKEQALEEEVIATIRKKIDEVNSKGNLHVQLVLNEPKAFSGIMAYGKFSGVSNYIIMAGPKTDDLDERVGYFGEELVLLAQQLGLNTCWAGLTYNKIENTYQLNRGEKIACYIALGYGETQGVRHKSKSAEEISNASEKTPEWFNRGIETVRLCPTAVNQQKFFFEYLGFVNDSKKPVVAAKRILSMFGYTQMDLGIARLHFEIGAGLENFEWENKKWIHLLEE